MKASSTLVRRRRIFAAAFGVGENDITISTVDAADAVALAAIQELYQQNQQLKRDLEGDLTSDPLSPLGAWDLGFRASLGFGASRRSRTVHPSSHLDTTEQVDEVAASGIRKPGNQEKKLHHRAH